MRLTFWSPSHTAHNLSLEVTVHYPYHPLKGQRLKVWLCPHWGEVPHYYAVDSKEAKWIFPVWMTEDRDWSPVNLPCIDIRALLNLRLLIDEAYSSLQSNKVFFEGGKDEDDGKAGTIVSEVGETGNPTAE
jgi:hypothetical protein